MSMPKGQVSMWISDTSSMPRFRSPSSTRGSLLAAAMQAAASGPSSAAFWPGCGSQRRIVSSSPTTLSISSPSARSQTVMRAARSIGSPGFHAARMSLAGSSSSVKTNKWFWLRLCSRRTISIAAASSSGLRGSSGCAGMAKVCRCLLFAPSDAANVQKGSGTIWTFDYERARRSDVQIVPDPFWTFVARVALRR